MKILLTGASGFFGNIIYNTLKSEHQILRLGRKPQNEISCDLASQIPRIQPVDMVIHSAGKAHLIPKSIAEKDDFFKVNVEGTQNLLSGIEKLPTLPKSLVFISSVAVYGIESGEGIKETASLKAESPYGLSKIDAENMVMNWGKRTGVNAVCLRLPLIVGKNPPGNLGAMLNAIKKGYYFRIGSGHARKSMVLGEHVASLLPRLTDKNGCYNLTDGQHPSLAEFDSYLSILFGRKVTGIPIPLLKAFAIVGNIIPAFPINSYRLSKLSQSLTFDDSLAISKLGWNPKSVIGNFKP